MQLKIRPILLLLLIVVSCSSHNAKSEEIRVLSTIYIAMPKFLPPPPPLEGSSKTNRNKKGKKLSYAIYNKFIDFESKRYISNVFYRYKSKKLFDEVSVDSVSYELARSLKKIVSNPEFPKSKLEKYLNEDLKMFDKRYPGKKEQKLNNIDGVISFSRVAFDNEYKKAAVNVGVFYDKLSSSECIYILEKENNEWNIKFIEVVEVS